MNLQDEHIGLWIYLLMMRTDEQTAETAEATINNKIWQGWIKKKISRF